MDFKQILQLIHNVLATYKLVSNTSLCYTVRS